MKRNPARLHHHSQAARRMNGGCCQKRRTIPLCLMLLTAHIGTQAAATDSLQTDTLLVDWYVSPQPTNIQLPTFGEAVNSLLTNLLPPESDGENTKDYSEAAFIQIDEPAFAWVNITGQSTLPQSKTDVRQVWVEVYDDQGNHFKKRALLKGQGGWSLKFPKRNFACQFCEGDWTAATTPDIRIGKWVKQDAFHFKAFYTDFCRGIGEISYKLFEHIVADRAPYWERGGYTESSKRARCFPDGFPCAIYLDGKFYGLFAWQLKKSHKNMNMKKTEELHIHLDGNLNNSSLFRGTVTWSQFDVQHPKEPYYTDKTKAAIRQLSQYHAELTALEASGADSTALKTAFEQRFDIASLLDYDVFHNFVCNGDGSLKNWQWFTYDGRKWMVTPYDLDQTFGLNLYGVVRPAVWEHEPLTEGPFYWIDRYYQKELRQRYAELRQNGTLTLATILPIMEDWYNRIGNQFYNQEKVKWPDSPCYGDAICNTGWQPFPDWSQYKTAPTYSATMSYGPGDVCKLEGRLWEATQSIKGTRPYIRNSQLDSLGRLERWVSERITYLDGQYKLQLPPNHIPNRKTSQPSDNTTYYNLQGQPVGTPTKGIYIRGGKKVLVR